MASEGKRSALDQLVAQMSEPGFTTRYRRLPSSKESSGHVSLAILVVSPPRSPYVRSWRKHARRCPACAAAFRYVGLKV